jgi:hypothetical protein
MMFLFTPLIYLRLVPRSYLNKTQMMMATSTTPITMSPKMFTIQHTLANEPTPMILLISIILSWPYHTTLPDAPKLSSKIFPQQNLVLLMALTIICQILNELFDSKEDLIQVAGRQMIGMSKICKIKM